MGKQKEDKLTRLYKAVSEKFDIGEFEDFKAKMQTPQSRKNFYDAVISEGFTLGDYNEYESAFSGKQKEVSTSGSLDTSIESPEPTQNTSTLEVPQSQPNTSSLGQSLEVPKVNSQEVEPTSPVEAPVVQQQQTEPLKDEDFYSVTREQAEANKRLPKSVYQTSEPTLGDIGLREVVVDYKLPSFLERIGYSVQSIPSEFNKVISSIPEYVYNLFSVPQNLLSNIEGLEWLNAGDNPYQDVIQMTTADGDNTANYINPLYSLSKLSESAKKASEYYNSQMKFNNDDILDALSKGNFADAGAKTVTGIIQSVPSMAIMAGTGGVSRAAELSKLSRVALNALPFASAKYQEIQNNPNLSSNGKLAVSALSGLSEIMFEQSFGTGKLLKDISSGNYNKKNVKNFVEGYIDKALESNYISATMLRGGISEASTTITNNIVAKYSGEDPKRDLNQGVVDSFIIGSASDGILGGSAKVLPAVTKLASQKIKEKISKINSIREDISSENVSELTKKSLYNSIESLSKEVKIIEEEEQRKISRLSTEQKKEIESLQSKIIELETAITDENISDESRVVIQSELDSVYEQIQGKISDKKDRGDQTIKEAKEELISNINAFTEKASLTDAELSDLSQDRVDLNELYKVPDINRLPEEVRTQLSEKVKKIADINIALSAPNVSIEEQTRLTTERTQVQSEINDLVDNLPVSVLQPKKDSGVVPDTQKTNQDEKTNDQDGKTIENEASKERNDEKDAGQENGLQEVIPQGVAENATPSSASSQDLIPDNEYNDFIDQGVVSDSRLNSIAEKVKNQETLSARENEIFTDKTREVNKIIENSVPKSTISAPKESDSVSLPPLREGGNERTMVFSEGEWKQQVGGELTATSKSIQGQAQEQFNLQSKPQENATSKRNIEQGGEQQREGAVSQEQRQQEDRQNQEEPITQAETAPSSSDSTIESRQKEKVNIPRFAIPLTESETKIAKRGDNVNQKMVIEDAIKPATRRGKKIGSQMERAIISGEITYEQAEKAIKSAGLSIPESISNLNPSNKKPLTPKKLLKGISDRLAQTGLATSIQFADSKTISDNVGVSGENVNGYVDADGNVVINEEKAGVDSPIHELGHVWEKTVERDNPELHARGMELIQSEDGKPYVDFVKKTQPNLSGNALYKEALAQAIGDNGAKLINTKKQNSIKKWLEDVWKFISTMTGISGMTPNQIANLNLEDFSKAVAVDLLSGKPYVKLESGAILTKSTDDVNTDEVQKFKNDFLLRMARKNGISFQGEVNGGELSASDFKDFLKFIEYSIKDGSIKNKVELRALASSIGLTNETQIDLAWEVSEPFKTTSTLKKSEIPSLVTESSDIVKMKPDEILKQAAWLVETGQINPVDIVEDVNRTFRALQPLELAVILKGESSIRKEKAGLVKMVRDQESSTDYEYMGLKGDKAVLLRIEILNDMIFQFKLAAENSKTAQSYGLLMRSAVVDEDFNIIAFQAKLKLNGDLTPELKKELDRLNNEYEEIQTLIIAREQELEQINKKIIEANLVESAKKQNTSKRVKNDSDVVSAASETLDSLDFGSFGLPTVRFQSNDVVRFSVQENNELTTAISDAVAGIKKNLSKNKMNLTDALESAINEINEKVGKGKWDEFKFRSAVINGISEKGVPVESVKPYVSKKGKLVVPRAYITQLVKDGNDTIDKLVDAVQEEVGSEFTSHSIRASISNYGEQALPKKNELITKVNQLKRIALLTVKIDELREGTRPLFKRSLLKSKSNEINDLEEELRTLLNEVPMTPEEIIQYNETANKRKQTYLRNVIKNTQKRIEDNDFAPANQKSKIETTDDELTRELIKKKKEVTNKFLEEKEKYELENRSLGLKLWDIFVSVWNVSRIEASLDIGAMSIQGALVTASNPSRALKTLKESAKPSLSKEEYDKWLADLQSNPFYDLAILGGLNLPIKGHIDLIREELPGGNFVNTLIKYAVAKPASVFISKAKKKDAKYAEEIERKIVENNPWEMANRNYDFVLADIRFRLFQELLTSQIQRKGLSNDKPNKDIVKLVADVVNTGTLGAPIPFVGRNKYANQLLSMIFFSSSKFYSSIKLLTWMPIKLLANNRQLFTETYGVDFNNKKIGFIHKGVARLAMLTLLPTIAANITWDSMDDEEKEKEGTPPPFYNPNILTPYHSDFMKLMPNAKTRVDLFAGIMGNVVVTSRIITGKYATASSNKVRNLGTGNEMTKEEVLSQFVQNKFGPTFGPLYRYLLKTDRDRAEVIDRKFSNTPFFLAPMWVTGAKEAFDSSDDITTNTILSTLGFFGLNYNVYGGAEFANLDGTNNKEVTELYERNELSTFTPIQGSQQIFIDGEVRPVVGSVYKDKWKPFYDKFMTEAVLSFKEKINKANWEKKEGIVNQLKGVALKYAEIETSGVYVDENYSKFKVDDVQYKLLKSQYALKAEYIKEYMDNVPEVDRIDARTEVVNNLTEKEKVKRSKEYINLLMKLSLYNKANAYANEKLASDLKNRKIEAVTAEDYSSDLEEQEE